MLKCVASAVCICLSADVWSINKEDILYQFNRNNEKAAKESFPK